MSWNEPTKAFVGGEQKVKDVCADCNNVHLSALDSYGKRFLEENDLMRPLSESRLDIKYDYEMLSRWQLKIAYNCFRASRKNADVIAQYKDFIIEGGKTPSTKRFFILLDLLKPHIH